MSAKRPVFGTTDGSFFQPTIAAIMASISKRTNSAPAKSVTFELPKEDTKCDMDSQPDPELISSPEDINSDDDTQEPPSDLSLGESKRAPEELSKVPAKVSPKADKVPPTKVKAPSPVEIQRAKMQRVEDLAKAKGTEKDSKKPQSNRARDWMLTSFLCADDHAQHTSKPIHELFEPKQLAKISYIVYVKQAAGETGRLHWQMFLQLKAAKGYTRGDMVKLFEGIDDSIHVERRVKSVEACVRYIKDDLKKTNCGDVIEHGTVRDMGTEAGKEKKSRQGSRTDLIAIRKDVENNKLSRKQFFAKYPDMAGKQFEALLYNELEAKRQHVLDLDDVPWKNDPWADDCNRKVKMYLDSKPKRKIVWIYSEGGKTGKTTRAKFLDNYMIQQQREGLLISNGATVRDLATMVHEDMSYCIFDIARSSTADDVPYAIIEGLSNGTITSGKYQPKIIKLKNPIHIIIFSNTVPDVSKLSRDRFANSVICLDPLGAQAVRHAQAEAGDIKINEGHGEWQEQRDLLEYNQAGIHRAEQDIKLGAEKKDFTLVNDAQARAKFFRRQLSLLVVNTDADDAKRSSKKSKVDEEKSIEVTVEASGDEAEPDSPKAKKAAPKRKRITR